MVQVGGPKKKADLDQLITLEICARNVLIFYMCWNPYFYSVIDKQCFEKTNLDQFNNFENPQTRTN